jgi:hypothetical protein
MKWFNEETFGNPEPPENHNVNPLVRCNTIEFWKKALSSYMPNKLMPWNELAGVGNPTRSTKLNALIKYVKKKEARGQGAESQARRSMKDDEHRRVIKICKEEGTTTVVKYGIPAIINYQFHMIARIDDSTQAQMENLQAHESFSFLLKTKLNWSKNVLEERDAPWQVVIGSMDATYCVHVTTGLWLEVFLENNPLGALTPYLFAFSEDTTIPKGGDKAKGMV